MMMQRPKLLVSPTCASRVGRYETINNRASAVRIRPRRHQSCPEADIARPAARAGFETRNGENPPFPRAGTSPAQGPITGVCVAQEFVMSRFENFAFSLGILLAGVLSLAAVPLA
jgi:hypothetical protein